MGSGSVALLWYACCCSFVAFVGILAAGLTIYGRKREERARSLGPVAAEGATAPEPTPEEPTGPSDPEGAGGTPDA